MQSIAIEEVIAIELLADNPIRIQIFGGEYRYYENVIFFTSMIVVK